MDGGLLGFSFQFLEDFQVLLCDEVTFKLDSSPKQRMLVYQQNCGFYLSVISYIMLLVCSRPCSEGFSGFSGLLPSAETNT